MYYTYVYPSFIGDICLVADDNYLLSASFCVDMISDDYEPIPDSAVLKVTAEQLDGYFAGRLKYFDLPLSFDATDFEIKVWKELLSVPYGHMTTYGAIAGHLGKKGAARAVGTACARNPFVIIVPCHRVGSVSKGALSGYAGGIARKLALLDFERDNMVTDSEI